MSWKVEKIFIIAFVALAGILLLLASFKETPEQNYAKRLEIFRQVLPEEARSAFDNNERDRTAQIIETQLPLDKDFSERYEKMKSDECINLFTPREVVDFFRDYFVAKKGK